MLATLVNMAIISVFGCADTFLMLCVASLPIEGYFDFTFVYRVDVYILPLSLSLLFTQQKFADLD